MFLFLPPSYDLLFVSGVVCVSMCVCVRVPASECEGVDVLEEGWGERESFMGLLPAAAS